MWLKWIKRIFATIGILVVLIIGFFLAVVYIYEDEVKQYAIEQLNKNLKVPVKVKSEDIELTIWDQFPKASLRFNNVLIPDYMSENGKDTMMFAKHIYLSFDFWDMMGGNYKVQTVSVENALFNLRVNSLGEGNFDIFKEDTTVVENSKFSFALKQVDAKAIQISYIDSMSNQKYIAYAPQLVFSGDFSETIYDLSVDAELKAKQIKSGGITYIRNKDVTLELDMRIDREANRYSIKKGDMNVQELLFQVTGDYYNQPDSSAIDMRIKGKNIDLASAITILPQEYMATLAKYKSKGLVVFDAKINGEISEKNIPRTSAEFYLQGGSLTELSTKASITDLSFDGFFDSDTMGTSILYIHDLKGKVDVGQINGNIKVENFESPKITANSFGSINLLQLKNFIQNENIETLTGNVDYNLDLVAETFPEGIKLTKSNGDFTFTNASLKLPTSPISYTKMNGDLVLNQNDAAISNFSGFVEDSDFSLDGVLKNLVPYIFNSEETLTIEADFRSNRLVLDDILAASEPQEINFEPVEAEPFILPKNIHLNLKSQIGSLYYGKFDANEVNGIVTLVNQQLSSKDVSFVANEGFYTCDISLKQNPDLTFGWKTKINAYQINIENFFTEMDNFGQIYLTDQHIKGKGTVDLEMGVLLDNNFVIDQNTLVAECQIHIQKGELINQPSLLEIGEYLEENSLVKVVVDTDRLKDNLKHVKFSDLQNTITIKDSKIYVPKMTLESNVLDLNLSGIHGFNDSIDYHFNFRLRKLLYENKKQQEFGPLVDDELGAKLFLHMYGHLDDPIYELDSEEKHDEIIKNIQEEKKNIKSILKSEVGIFKKDSTVLNYEEPKKIQPTFEIEWEEFDQEDNDLEESDPKNTQQEKEIKKKDKGVNKLFQKLGIEPEKETKHIDYEIE